MAYYQTWRDVPESAWRWPNFSPAEIACRGTGAILIDEEALDRLQALRDRIGRPFIVNSAYRSPEHNRAVGGAKASKHMEGVAFDISMANHDPAAFEAAACASGFTGFGTYPQARNNFMHIDLGPSRRWGDPFPKAESRFSAEPPLIREDLGASRTLQGGGAAGIGVGGAGAADALANAPPPPDLSGVLAEAQEMVQPLVPYADAMKWAFLALALGGVAVTIYARFDDWKRGRR